jgi:hypothetical protein
MSLHAQAKKPTKKGSVIMLVQDMFDYLEENGIATSAEIELVTKIDGWNSGTAANILYARTGYRAFEQLEDDDE